jgi:hypothetical protein
MPYCLVPGLLRRLFSRSHSAAKRAAQVRSLAKTRRLSANRMLVELIEDGMEAQKRKQQQFFDVAARFRSATDPEQAKQLGDELGRMAFGG